jgi:glutaredoxin
MRLSHYQRLVLQNMLELQRREPSYRRAFRSLVPAWIVFLAIGFAAWYAIRTWLHGNGLEYIALGLVLGAIAAQAGAVRHFIQSWALQKQVLDLDAVKRLLAEDDAGKAAGERLPAPRPLPFGWRTAVAVGVTIVALPIAMDWAMTAYHDPTRNTAGRQVKLYATSWCGYCRVVRAHLRSRGVEFEEFDVEKSITAHYAWSATHARGVPVTVIDNQVVRGANLEKLDESLRSAGFTIVERGTAPAGSDALMSTLKR